MLFLVAYDLVREPASSYKPLIDRLRALGATRILESTWLLPNSATHSAIRDDLKAHGKLDANDRLLVAQLHNRAAWTKLLAGDQVVLDLFKQA